MKCRACEALPKLQKLLADSDIKRIEQQREIVRLQKLVEELQAKQRAREEQESYGG